MTVSSSPNGIFCSKCFILITESFFHFRLKNSDDQGSVSGMCNGHGKCNGNYHGNGSGNCHGQSNGNCHGNGNDNSHGHGHGNSKDHGHGNGHASVTGRSRLSHGTVRLNQSRSRWFHVRSRFHDSNVIFNVIKYSENNVTVMET